MKNPMNRLRLLLIAALVCVAALAILTEEAAGASAHQRIPVTDRAYWTTEKQIQSGSWRGIQGAVGLGYLTPKEADGGVEALPMALERMGGTLMWEVKREAYQFDIQYGQALLWATDWPDEADRPFLTALFTQAYVDHWDVNEYTITPVDEERYTVHINLDNASEYRGDKLVGMTWRTLDGPQTDIMATQSFEAAYGVPYLLVPVFERNDGMPPEVEWPTIICHLPESGD